ncbi:MAG: TRAP transporter large permease [Hyphomicrobiales bacterium]
MMFFAVMSSLLVLIGLSIPVGISLFMLGFGVDGLFSRFPLIRGLGQLVWSSSNSSTLIAIALFVLLGEILARGGIAERSYAALDKWVSWLPGGLIHANIATAALFSATSGSSVATAASVATVAMPQAEKLGYDPRLFSGAIAAGGTLGIMIPPSINLIVYGFLTQTSIPRLFLAGLLPGLIMAGAFMIVTAIACLARPSLGGVRRSFTRGERLKAFVWLAPLFFLFFVVIGSIYAGWATPTESAAIGVVIAFIIALTNGGVSGPMMYRSLSGAIRITAMIMLVVIGASFLNFTLIAAGMGRELRYMLTELHFTPFATLMAVIALYIVLGFFIETLSLMVATIPIVIPVMTGMGFDKLWFGIMLIVLIEMALVTPPVGLNLYVVQGVRQSGGLSDVTSGIIPYLLVMLVMIALLIAFPMIALYLPSTLS